MSAPDIDQWFAPECSDDTNDPAELGMIQHDGQWHTPAEVSVFIQRLQELVTTGRAREVHRLADLRTMRR